MEANSFLLELTLTEMGGKNINDRVASPESVPIHLKVNDNSCTYIFRQHQNLAQ